MDLGKMLGEALDQQGLAVTNGSGIAARSLQDAAEAFLARVREAEQAETVSAGESIVPPFTMDM